MPEQNYYVLAMKMMSSCPTEDASGKLPVIENKDDT